MYLLPRQFDSFFTFTKKRTKYPKNETNYFILLSRSQQRDTVLDAFFQMTNLYLDDVQGAIIIFSRQSRIIPKHKAQNYNW